MIVAHLMTPVPARQVLLEALVGASTTWRLVIWAAIPDTLYFIGTTGCNVMSRAKSAAGTKAGRPLAYGLGSILLAAIVAVAPARSEGALATGEPADLAEDGVSFGFSYGYTTMEEARERALAECKGQTGASDEVKALCKIVATFSGQCVSVALDPAEGEPGFGWAVGADQAAADLIALAKCRAVSKPERHSFCRIAGNACDSK
jgi:hypothetical protein